MNSAAQITLFQTPNMTWLCEMLIYFKRIQEYWYPKIADKWSNLEIEKSKLQKNRG